MEPKPEEESLIQKRYLLIVVLAMAAVAVVGIITMQLFLAALVVVLILGLTVIIQILRKTRQQGTGGSGCFGDMDEGSVVIAAALFAFIGMALSVWVVWAVALAVLFLIQQSLARIEKRMDLIQRKE
jgi:hypothetical protein